jgi:hypothetical protein
MISKRLAWLIVAMSVWAVGLTLAPPVWAQAVLEGSGIPYSKEIGALVHAPKGWIFDNQSGVSQGVHCVMYPRGTTWRTASEVIYVTIGELASGQALEGFVAADVEEFRKKSPGLEVVTLDPVGLASGQESLVRRFRGDPFGNHECIAYAQLGGSVAVFVLSCRTSEGYEKSVGPFRDMVAKAALVKMQSGKEPQPAGEEAAGPAGPVSYGYSHWARFKAGTSVSFTYTMRSPAASEEMVKTITLKEVTPGFVRLDYRESAPAPAAAPAAARPGTKTIASAGAGIYQYREEDYGEAEEEFETTTPVESLLGYGISGYVSSARSRPLGSGEEEIDWRGGKLKTSWAKYRFASGAMPVILSIWRCKDVPGGLFKFVREIEGEAASREEVVVSALHIVQASAEEIAGLLAARQPVIIEVPARDYLRVRCRLFRTFVEELTVSLDPQGELADIKAEFDLDRGRISEELGPTESAKLAPLLDIFEASIKLRQRVAEIMTKTKDDVAAGRIDEEDAREILAETEKLRSRDEEIARRMPAAFGALRGISVKFIKKPG